MFLPQPESRSFKRMLLDLPISITKGALTTTGICKDLSSTGMSISFTDENLLEGDVIQIQLATSDQRFAPLDAQATLLRINKLQQGFDAAVQFIYMK